MKILLIQPEYIPVPAGFRIAARTEPLAMELLAATVPDHEVEILDLRNDPDLLATFRRFAPDVVGVTALTTEVYAALEVLGTVKAENPEVFTLAGGHHATLLPDDFCLPFVDAICLGEGEETFPQLVAELAAGRDFRRIPNLVWQDADGHFVRNARCIPDLDGDSVPMPRRDLTTRYTNDYFWLQHRPDTSLATGRGCPFRCNFCSVWEFYAGKTRQMSVERIMQEVRTIRTPHVTILDDNFMLNARREYELADRLRAEGVRLQWSMECRTDSIVRHPQLIEQWAELGLEGVLLGLEGASDETLAGVNKRNSIQANNEAIRILQANGVMIWGAFIVDPDWSADQFKILYDYVTRHGITHTQFTVLTPLPGTQLYRDRHADLVTRDYTCFDTLHPVVPTRLPREEFYRHFASLYLKPNLDHVYDLLRQGRIDMEHIRLGHRVYKELGTWERYLENDPLLRTRPPGDSVVRQMAEAYAARA